MSRAALLISVTVGFVLADSAIVTLALPDILTDLHGTVAQVAWVLIAFNLVLGVVVVPVAVLVVRLPTAPVCALGIAVFAAASAWCAVADSLTVLITARCVQAVGGAVALVGSLELLMAALGDERGTGRWILAGLAGTATGPVVGGLLTQAFSWPAIFIVQAPLAAVAIPAALAMPSRARDAGRRDRPVLAPNVTLLLLSAALTAAVFVLVLMLVDGWGRSPGRAALTVTALPLAALVAARFARTLNTAPRVEIGTGCVLVAAGLVGLAIPPAAQAAWTIGPQVLVGLGLGLTVDRLTAAALGHRVPRGLHGAWTIAARHLGVVVGLAVLTPVFTADLADARGPAQQAITAAVLDARLTGGQKVTIAERLGQRLTEDRGRVPDLRPVFRGLKLPVADRAAGAQLERRLDDQLERAATRAFRTSFLLAAALAVLAALSTLALSGRPV